MALLILIFIELILLLYVLLLIYYKKAWKEIAEFEYSIDNKDVSGPFISIIVPVRNEANNIANLIRAVKNQNYPSQLFELIIVDDHSTDNTTEIISPFLNEQIQLVSLRIEETIVAYKKMAIDLGIKNSKGELIITTDADCTMPANWLKTIAAFYNLHHPKMIVMPVAIKNNHTALGIFQMLDFMSLQGITGAAVHKKFHGMCNGANLAYTRTVFEEVNGFTGIDSIASGDDMLLMHKISNKYKNEILFLKSKDVIVETQPETNINGFINQRIRWASKADKYEDKSLFPVLLLVYLVNISMAVLFFMCLFFNFEFSILNFYCLLSIKTLSELYFLIPVSRFFGYTKLLYWFPLFQPFHIVYTVIAGWLGKFGSYRWKGRVLNGLSRSNKT
jgi:cellulose synthase/poly-beta-1,6-N-acetylglucosamine synthase-like glycosyltransferase